MSMDDSMVRVMKVGEIILVGVYQPTPPVMLKGNGMLDRPRLLGTQQQPAGPPRKVFMELIGNPEQINIPDGALIWEPKDEEMIRLYQQAVTGLVLASPNVIPIGGRA